MSWRPMRVFRGQRYVLTFRFGVHWVFRCSRGKHGRIPFAASRDQIRHQLRFCCDSFFTCIFLRSFRHRFALVDGTEMADVEQNTKDGSIHHVWNFPLSESASWFLVSMYLMWILRCKLIVSNNQSRASLWVLETCLIVGLLPFMIILITASLSSKICNIHSFLTDRSPCTGLLWFVFPWRTVTIRSCERSVIGQRVRLLIERSAQAILPRRHPHGRGKGRSQSSGGWSGRWERQMKSAKRRSERDQTLRRMTHGWDDAHKHLSQCRVT